MADENITNSGPGMAEPASKLESGKTHVKKAAEDLRAAAESKAAELRSAAEAKAQELRGRAENAYAGVRTRALTIREDGEQYVRENPTQAVLTALGIGFVLGLIFRR
jgi:ElaB/YqjD/DUF883 family membrane-anchored ribosome-binding protein